MKEIYIAWTLGASTAALALASAALNVLFASSLANVKLLAALRALLFVAFAVSLVGAATVAFFVTTYVQKLDNRSISFDHRSAWRRFGLCAGIVSLAIAISGTTLIWLAVREKELPRHMLRQSSITLLIVWFTLWGVQVGVQVGLFVYIGLWTRRVLKAQSVGQSDLNFGIRAPQTAEFRSSRYSFNSQDPTLHSPPRTPARSGSSVRNSSSTRVGPGSSRSKLITKRAERSSEDFSAFPAGEATSIDSAFDNWDTSSVHQEIRYVVHSSPPVTRGGLGLETIPGSRSVSPAGALEGPFLPDSPHTTSSETATTFNWNSSSPPPKQIIPSSPPSSSPPNFSRPTSRRGSTSQSQIKPPPSLLPALGSPSMSSELIHPLFRPNSPRPPPVAVGVGTMLTASPLALTGQPITPRTLARMRSNTLPQQWKPISSPDSPTSKGRSIRHSRDSTTCDSDQGPGSPGPSILADDDGDLPLPSPGPHIGLPGFVLSAGQRSSLLGYGRRKSKDKQSERPKSAYSGSSSQRMSGIAIQ